MSHNTITLTDAKDLVSKKILINKMSIDNLKTQIEFAKAAIKLQYLTSEAARKKIPLVEQLNEIFEKQLIEFTEERQLQCNELYEQINAIDQPTEEYLVVLNTLEKKEEEMLNLMPKIQYLESQLPSQQEIDVYKIKVLDDQSGQKNTSCSNSGVQIPDIPAEDYDDY